MSRDAAASEPEMQAQDHLEQHIEPPRIDEVDFCCLFYWQYHNFCLF